MFKKGIVDARKVTRSALQNAASIAAMVLTTETLDHRHPREAGRSRPAVATATAAETWTSSPPNPHELEGPSRRREGPSSVRRRAATRLPTRRIRACEPSGATP